ncbi:MAG TPA: PspA/IM30 family protein [Acidimicrobiia bacterium]|jgi:phage shock protein A|nr:PspA/IM30 family protein [Acidimicrobiia bacterium]
MFKRLIAYFRSWFKSTAEEMMDPEIEIQSAIDEAKRRDQDLRNQAAKVIAHKTQLESQIERAAEAVGEGREMAKQALLKAEESKARGDQAGVGKWTQAAQSLAMKLQASENNLESLKGQFEMAVTQAEQAKEAVQTNAMKVQELAARRLEMLGTLEQAKMQEAVNNAVESMSATVGDEGPDLAAVEDKIEMRKAEAMAKAELHEATPEGAEAELRKEINMSEANAKLDELRAELGI